MHAEGEGEVEGHTLKSAILHKLYIARYIAPYSLFTRFTTLNTSLQCVNAFGACFYVG